MRLVKEPQAERPEVWLRSMQMEWNSHSPPKGTMLSSSSLNHFSSSSSHIA